MLKSFFVMGFVAPHPNSSSNACILCSQGYFSVKVVFGLQPHEASLEGQSKWKTFCSYLKKLLKYAFKSKQDRCW